MVQYWLGIRNSQAFFQLLALTTEAALAPIQSPIKTSASTPAGRRATMVQTWNCDLEDQKPELIIISCADGGSMSK
jgi:hypothetical protein